MVAIMCGHCFRPATLIIRRRWAKDRHVCASCARLKYGKHSEAVQRAGR